MSSTPPGRADQLDRSALHSVVHQGLVLVALLAVLGLSTLLPGADRQLPSVAVTIREGLVGIGTVAIVVLLAHAMPAVARLTRSGLEGPESVVHDAGRVAAATVAFAAVLVAHRGLAGVAVPELVARESVWAYDLAFLVVALGPLTVVANGLRRNLGAVAELVTEGLVEGHGLSTGESTETT